MSIEADVDAIRRVKDPVERARVLHAELLPLITVIRRQVVSLRAAAVLEAHESGMSFAEMAETLDVSRALVQQMVEQARAARD